MFKEHQCFIALHNKAYNECFPSELTCNSKRPSISDVAHAGQPLHNDNLVISRLLNVEQLHYSWDKLSCE